MPLLSRAQQDRLVAIVSEGDKLQHIAVSLVLTQLFAAFTGLATAMVLAFVVGLGKEWWDAHYGSGFCWYDIIANIMGILVGAALLMPFLT